MLQTMACCCENGHGTGFREMWVIHGIWSNRSVIVLKKGCVFWSYLVIQLFT